MSAGIYDYDAGIVWGTTWHGIQSYKQIDRPVEYLEARAIFDYPMEKRQLKRVITKDNVTTIVDALAWEVIRTDVEPEIVICDAVGKSFHPMNNAELLDLVHREILVKRKHLKMESVGTLFNGATAFVNILVDRWKYEGDPSDQQARIMYYNPVGKGSYKVGAHTVRIVCFNTLSASESQAAANGSLKSVSHTPGSEETLKDTIIEIDDTLNALKDQKSVLKQLIHVHPNTKDTDEFLEQIFVTDESVSDRVRKNNEERKCEVEQMYWKYNALLDAPAAGSWYAFVQAFTEWCDSERKRTRGDWTYRRWDGLVGDRMQIKQGFFKRLTNWLSKSGS